MPTGEPRALFDPTDSRDQDAGVPLPEFDPHALRRMRQRRIAREQVQHVIENFDSIRKAQTYRSGQTPADILTGTTADGRRLDVYVDPDTDLENQPAYVRTAAWA